MLHMPTTTDNNNLQLHLLPVRGGGVLGNIISISFQRTGPRGFLAAGGRRRWPVGGGAEDPDARRGGKRR